MNPRARLGVRKAAYDVSSPRRTATEASGQVGGRAERQTPTAAELRAQLASRPSGWVYGPVDEWGEGDLTRDRCRCCSTFRTAELHDPCIANLPGVVGACCGHGCSGRFVYVDVIGVGRLEGPAAARKMRELGGNPPPQAFYLDPIGEP
jgi:hypothetical protein